MTLPTITCPIEPLSAEHCSSAPFAATAARSVALTALSAPDIVPNAVRLAATTTTDLERLPISRRVSVFDGQRQTLRTRPAGTSSGTAFAQPVLFEGSVAGPLELPSHTRSWRGTPWWRAGGLAAWNAHGSGGWIRRGSSRPRYAQRDTRRLLETREGGRWLTDGSLL